MDTTDSRISTASTLVALVIGGATTMFAVSSPDTVQSTGNGAASVIAAVLTAVVVGRWTTRAPAVVITTVGAVLLCVGVVSSSAGITLLGALGGGVVLGVLAARAAERRAFIAVFGVATLSALLLSVTVIAVPIRFAGYAVAENTDRRASLIAVALIVTVVAIGVAAPRRPLESSTRTTLVSMLIALVGLVPVLATTTTAAIGAAGVGPISTASSWTVATLAVTLFLVVVAVLVPSAGALILGGAVLWLLSRPASVVVLISPGDGEGIVQALVVALGAAIGAAAGLRARPAFGVPLAFLCVAATIAALQLGTANAWIAVAAVAVSGGAVVGACTGAATVPAAPTIVAAGLLIPLALTAMPASPISADFGWTAYTPLTDSIAVTRPATGTLVSMICLVLCAVGAEAVRRRRA